MGGGLGESALFTPYGSLQQHAIEMERGMMYGMYGQTLGASQLAAMASAQPWDPWRVTYAADRHAWPFGENTRFDWRQRQVHRFMVTSWIAAGVAVLVAFGPDLLRRLLWWFQ